jgi:hypothetical protein
MPDCPAFINDLFTEADRLFEVWQVSQSISDKLRWIDALKLAESELEDWSEGVRWEAIKGHGVECHCSLCMM